MEEGTFGYYKEYYLDYHRRYTLVINGKSVKVIKRPRPESNRCELCNHDTTGYRLHYHHWDDSKPEFGVWLCRGCHFIAEAIDKGYIDEDYFNRYLQIKDAISNLTNTIV